MDSHGRFGGGGEEKLVDFMTRFTESEQFNRVFREGMGLVEETADYLDGPGRAEARALSRPAALAYATESMRLTTRLMQLASWLLLQRAVSCGEIGEEAAREEKNRINLIEAAAPVQEAHELPEGLLALAERSRQLQKRILKLDDMINARVAPAGENPLRERMDMLAEAFGSES